MARPLYLWAYPWIPWTSYLREHWKNIYGLFVGVLYRSCDSFCSSLYCLEWKIPPREKSVKFVLVSSFSHPSIEKLASTVAVFGKAEAKPPQNSCKWGNQVFVQAQDSLKLSEGFMFSSTADLNNGSSRNTCRNKRKSSPMRSIPSALKIWFSHSLWTCIVFTRSLILILDNLTGRTGGRASFATFEPSFSSIFDMPAAASTKRRQTLMTRGRKLSSPLSTIESISPKDQTPRPSTNSLPFASVIIKASDTAQGSCLTVLQICCSFKGPFMPDIRWYVSINPLRRSCCLDTKVLSPCNDVNAIFPSIANEFRVCKNIHQGLSGVQAGFYCPRIA